MSARMFKYRKYALFNEYRIDLSFARTNIKLIYLNI